MQKLVSLKLFCPDDVHSDTGKVFQHTRSHVQMFEGFNDVKNTQKDHV